MNWKRFFGPEYDTPWDVYYAAVWVLFVLWIWVGLWPADPERFARGGPWLIFISLTSFAYVYWDFRGMLRQGLNAKHQERLFNSFVKTSWLPCSKCNDPLECGSWAYCARGLDTEQRDA